MKLPKLLEVVKKARRLLSDPGNFCKGELYECDRQGYPQKWCALGAVQHFGANIDDDGVLYWLRLGVESTDRGTTRITTLNDDYGREWVLRAFDFTILELEAQIARDNATKADN